MSAAAGAPPPPPPPPPPGPAPNGNPFDDIPAELLLIIFGYVGTNNLMNLALAIYPTLERHNLSPELTPATLAHILRLTARPINLSLYPAPVARMPVELWLIRQDFDHTNEGQAESLESEIKKKEIGRHVGKAIPRHADRRRR